MPIMIDADATSLRVELPLELGLDLVAFCNEKGLVPAAVVEQLVRDHLHQ
jgi:hypothetical protein